MSTPPRPTFTLHKLSHMAGYASAGIMLAVLLAGFVPPMEGQEVRRPVAKNIASLRPQDYPLPIISNSTGSSIRATVNKEFLHFQNHANIHNTIRPQGWIDFSAGQISLNTSLGPRNMEQSMAAMALVLAEEGFSFEENAALMTTQPSTFGEALGPHGQPLRWKHQEQDAMNFDPMCDLERPSMEALQAKVLTRAYAPGSGESYTMAARRYAPIVQKMAARYKLRPSLIYAIIHTESNFRPRLVSSASAMGLMQLLPSTAGGEVHRYLYGHTAPVSLEELSNPERNITFGVTYFHLLMTQHLPQVVQHRSREICAIAAYNMGIGRLLRFFGPTDAAAFAAINALTPQEVFTRLTQVLPIAETRRYVSRVSHRENLYRHM